MGEERRNKIESAFAVRRVMEAWRSRCCILILLAAILAVGACSTNVPKQGLRKIDAHEAFARIEIGSSRIAVEDMLGAPVMFDIGRVAEFNDGKDVWYLPPPELGPADSPWGPGSILIHFEDGRVVGKELNPYVRRHPGPEDLRSMDALDTLEAFARIEVGSSRAVVEDMLGAPVLVEGNRYDAFGRSHRRWYLPPPELRPAESHWGPGSIVIRFEDDRAVEKKLNPQVR